MSYVSPRFNRSWHVGASWHLRCFTGLLLSSFCRVWRGVMMKVRVMMEGWSREVGKGLMKPVTCRKGGPQSGGPWFWRKIRRFSGRKQHLGSPASSVMTSHRFPAKSSPLRPRIASILQDFEDMFSKYREHVLLRQIKTNFLKRYKYYRQVWPWIEIQSNDDKKSPLGNEENETFIQYLK